MVVATTKKGVQVCPGVIDAVLRFKIVGIGGRPMLIQRRTDLLIARS
jgi:hypothetical protein